MSTQWKEVRTEEIRLAKEDQAAANIRYYGRSDNFTAADSDLCWQILREYTVGEYTTITYALKGSFVARWDQRTTYFSAANPAHPDQESFPANADTASTVWDMKGLTKASYAVSWTGLSQLTSFMEVQASVTGAANTWNVIDEDQSTFYLNSASGIQNISMEPKRLPRYVRLFYTKNTENSGTITIKSDSE